MEVENPHEVVQYQRYLSKVNIFCARCQVHRYFFTEWLVPQLVEIELENLIYQKYGTDEIHTNNRHDKVFSFGLYVAQT